MSRRPGSTSDAPEGSRQAEVLVPRGLRTPVALLVLLAAVVVVTLGVVHRGTSAPDRFDRAVTAHVVRVWPLPGPLAYVVDGLVTLVPALVTLALLVAAGVATRRPRLSVLAVLGPLGTAAVTTVLKPFVGRTIHGANLAFPSGHTGYATAIGLVLGLLLLALVRPASRALTAALLLAPALVLGAVMALDQLVLDAHYPSDAVGGFCTALAVVLGLALVLDQVLARRPAARWSQKVDV